jgi:hypothetical protein
MTPPMKSGERWISISAGYQHTCGLRTGYYVSCFGDGGSELVTGDARKNAPMPPDWERVSKGGFQWTNVACGTTFTTGVMNETRKGYQIKYLDPPANTNRDWDASLLAKLQPGVPANRTLLVWGSAYYGQMTELPVFSDWRVVRAGHFHVCGIREGGALLCWGDNLRAQCDVPSTPTKWKDVSCGQGHTCAIADDNTMHCWGSNHAGQCDVACEDYWVAVAAGESHTCGIAADTTLRCWGSNTFGQTNVPTSATGTPLPYWSEIQVGSEHTCGIREYTTAAGVPVRELLCWGGNTYGQTNVPIGNITIQSCATEFSTTPQQVLQRRYKYVTHGDATPSQRFFKPLSGTGTSATAPTAATARSCAAQAKRITSARIACSFHWQELQHDNSYPGAQSKHCAETAVAKFTGGAGQHEWRRAHQPPNGHRLHRCNRN